MSLLVTFEDSDHALAPGQDIIYFPFFPWQRTPRGCQIHDALLQNKSFIGAEKDRIHFVRTICLELMRTCQTRNAPTMSEKAALAEAVIHHYPFLQGPTREDGSGNYVSTSSIN